MTENFAEILATTGVSLDKMGIQEVAPRREDALRAIRAIRAIREASVPILGSGVYFKKHGNIEPAYANWYVERQSSDSWKDFTDRSRLKAEIYIVGFSNTT